MNTLLASRLAAAAKRASQLGEKVPSEIQDVINQIQSDDVVAITQNREVLLGTPLPTNTIEGVNNAPNPFDKNMTSALSDYVTEFNSQVKSSSYGTMEDDVEEDTETEDDVEYVADSDYGILVDEEEDEQELSAGEAQLIDVNSPLYFQGNGKEDYSEDISEDEESADHAEDYFENDFSSLYSYNEHITIVHDDGKEQVYRIEDLIEAVKFKNENEDLLGVDGASSEERDNRINNLVMQLSSAVISKYGDAQIDPAEVLVVMTERQQIFQILDEMFKMLGHPVNFTALVHSRKSAFGNRVIDIASLSNAARVVAVNYKNAISDAEKAKNEMAKMQSSIDTELQQARAKNRAAEKEWASAREARSIVVREIESFNMPADEKPFVLRGRYESKRKVPKGDKTIVTPRITYIAAKPKGIRRAKETGSLILTRYLYATSNREKALAFASVDEAQTILGRLRKKFAANELKPEQKVTASKLNSIKIYRYNLEALIRS